jgi:hypothetical protein
MICLPLFPISPLSLNRANNRNYVPATTIYVQILTVHSHSVTNIYSCTFYFKSLGLNKAQLLFNKIQLKRRFE